MAVVAFLVFIVSKNRKGNRLTPLVSLAFAFVLAGILFGNNRLIGYGLMGVGVLLAVVDMYNRSKQKKNQEVTPAMLATNIGTRRIVDGQTILMDGNAGTVALHTE